MRPAFLILFLTSCTEYELSTQGDALPGDDSGTTDGPGAGDDPNTCSDVDTSPIGVAVDESCKVSVEVGSWNPVVEWSNDTPGDSYTTPIVGQLTDDNGDGVIDDTDQPDVVVAGGTGGLTVMSGDGQTIHWTRGGLGNEPSTPAIADLDNDGRPEVIATGSSGFFAYRGDTGTPYWSNNSGSSQNVCGGVGIYDLNGDGMPEIVQGSQILNGQTGVLQATGQHGAGTGYSSGVYAAFGVAADIDLDGTLEVVVGNALYTPTGQTIWYNGQSDGFVAVGNFDSDPYGEIVVTTYPGMVRLQDHDGTVLWSGSYTGSTIGPPTVADFDNDGEPEIGVAGNGVYVVLDTDGTQLWSRGINDYSSGFTGSAVFDFEGDGEAEVVFADENDVWVFDGATGSVKLKESQHSSATCSEYPAIADVDGDGQTEIIYTSSAYSGSERGVRVIGDANGTWQPARTTWNQHSYDITNVENSTGKIPSTPNPNWSSYNTFRSGDLTASTGGAFSDAIPVLGDICTDECDDGILQVVLHIGNAGVADLPPGVPVSLYTQDGSFWRLLATERTADAIAPGDSEEGIIFTLFEDDIPEGTLRFVVDDDNGSEMVGECDEDNNELIISEGLCP
ncbi:MAG: PQQ-binding-like beta-propeller repeat protein [Myxococcota bacterium]|nr:PQQ-binding-like beta-propeller repeat protein [Myxococcota bacterium]